jgi:hypothetical protein
MRHHPAAPDERQVRRKQRKRLPAAASDSAARPIATLPSVFI